MTLEQLEKFIRIRNRSRFSSNLQFQIDANAAGFSLDDLGQATRQPDGSYTWNTSFGRLVEECGKLRLESHPRCPACGRGLTGGRCTNCASAREPEPTLAAELKEI